MHEPHVVGFLQRIARLPQQVDGACGGHRSVTAHELGQVHARQKFHHVIERAVVRSAVVENVDAVPVREAGRGLNLALDHAVQIRRLNFKRDSLEDIFLKAMENGANMTEGASAQANNGNRIENGKGRADNGGL